MDYRILLLAVIHSDLRHDVFWDLIAGWCRARGGGQAWIFILHESAVKATFNTTCELLAGDGYQNRKSGCCTKVTLTLTLKKVGDINSPRGV